MDHFDNCAAFEDGFARALIRHERKAGHMRALPPVSFGSYGGAVPNVVGLTRKVLTEIARTGEIIVERNRRPLPMIGSADIHSQISSLVTRGLIETRDATPTHRTLAITDLGRQSLAISG